MKTKLKLIFICHLLSAVCLPAFAQGTAFTYQGRVTDNGTNFAGAGLFKFALVTGTNTSQQATAVANPPSGGFITIINVSFGGSDYVGAPAVTITGGGGSGATATAAISSGGVVTNITVNNPGSGYTSTPTVTVAPPPPTFAFSTWWSNDGTSVNGSEPATAVSVGVANGLFTVTLGDTTLSNMTAIPAALFAQPGLLLRIWFNDGVNGSVALSPVQALTPAPSAAFAYSASNLLGTLPAMQVSGTLANTNLPASPGFSGTVSAVSFAGDGTGLTNVNAATLGGLGASNFWQTTGNTGTSPTNGNFLGTLDVQPVELRVGGLRALRLEPDPRAVPEAANLIGGFTNNVIQQPGSGGDVIVGGGYDAGVNVIHSNSAGVFIGAGSANQVGPNVNDAVIAGGFGNTIQEFDGFIGGGVANAILSAADHSVIGGGQGNKVVGSFSLPVYGVIAGGQNNTIQTNSSYNFIGGGYDNTIYPYAPYSTIGGGLFNQIYGDTNDYGTGVIVGGYEDTINSNSWNSFIGGGGVNTIGTNSDHSVIVGGYDNSIQGLAEYGTIGGGVENTVGAYAATVPGGLLNFAGGAYSFAAGQYALATNNGAFVWSDDSTNSGFGSTTSNQFNVRAMGGVRFVTGGAGMTLDGQSVGPSGNYVFAYSTALQPVTLPSTFQNATFNNEPQLNGWTYNSGTSQFFCNQTGVYMIQYTAEALIADSMSMRGALNFIEIPGSQAYANSSTFGTATVISKSFLASVSAGSLLTIQYTGNSPSDELNGGGSGTVLPSISLTITRIQ